MNHCTSCGSPIPEGQSSCSMCYGDPAHGSDGYYEAEMRRAEEEEENRRDAFGEPF